MLHVPIIIFHMFKVWQQLPQFVFFFKFGRCSPTYSFSSTNALGDWCENSSYFLQNEKSSSGCQVDQFLFHLAKEEITHSQSYQKQIIYTFFYLFLVSYSIILIVNQFQSTAHPQCNGHSTNISAYRGVKGKSRDSSFQERVSHTYILKLG